VFGDGREDLDFGDGYRPAPFPCNWSAVSELSDTMRNIVLFLEVPNAGSRAKYYDAARFLDLLPVPVTRSAPGGSNVFPSDCLQVSSMDVGSILSAIDRIGRQRIAGVFAGGSAHAELAARVAAALGRPHADPEAISLCNDKLRLRDFLAQKGLNTVDYQHVTTALDARAAAERLGGAVVVKPLFSTGSDGTRICRTPDEAASHARRLLKRKSDGLLVEKYIDGPHYGVEFFDGRPLDLKGFVFPDGPFPIIVGVNIPAPVKSEQLREINDFAKSIIKEVGLLSGPAFMELRCFDAEKHVIEINPRPSLYSPIELYIPTGLNIAKLCVKFSCGIPYHEEFSVRHNNMACVGRHIVRNGSSVRAIKGLEEARKVSGVKSILVNEQNFGRLGPPTCARDRIVAVHSEADNIELAEASTDMAIKKLIIIYDKFPMNIVRFYGRRVYRSFIDLSNTLRLLLPRGASICHPRRQRA
jgi:argininosuccinate lyase